MGIRVDPDWWRHLFDEVYLQTDARSVCDPDLTRREVEVIWQLLDMEPGLAILDLCGGQGRHSLELAARGGRCTVVDYSGHLVEVGQRTAAGKRLDIRFHRGDARDTGLTGDAFDRAIIMGNSMGYLPGEDDDLKILREAYRLLRSGSRILVDVADGEQVSNGLSPNAWHEVDEDLVVCRQRELDNGRVRARELVLSRSRGLVRDQAYAIRVYDADTLAQTVSRAGFNEVGVHRGFSPHDVEGDYGFMNRRVLVTGRKT